METYINSGPLKSSKKGDRLSEVRDTLEYEQVCLKVDISEEIWNAMQAKGVSQADLARKIGKSRAYVTKVLKGDTNFTFDTVAAILWQLDHKIEIKVRSRESAALKDQLTFATYAKQEGLNQSAYNQPAKFSGAVKEAFVGGDHDQSIAA